MGKYLLAHFQEHPFFFYFDEINHFIGITRYNSCKSGNLQKLSNNNITIFLLVTSASQCHSSISCTSLMDPRPAEGPTKSLSVCLSFCPFNIFLRIGSSVLFTYFSPWYIVGKMVKSPLFSRKFIFAQIWAEKAPNDPKIGFFRFFEKFCH